MRLRVFDKKLNQIVPKVEVIKLDHLDEGRPVTFVALGKEWAFGERFTLRIEQSGDTDA